MARGNPRGRRLAPLVPAALGTLVVQTTALRFLRVPLSLQWAVLATAVWVTLAGAGLFRRATAQIDDVGARLALWFLGGMTAVTVVSYLLFHPAVGRALGLDGRAAAASLSLAVVGLGGLVVGLVGRPAGSVRAADPDAGHVAVLLLALVLSGATIYGAVNRATVEPGYYGGEDLLARLDPRHPLVGSTLPEWGATGDFYVHLVLRPAAIVERGLPTRPVERSGLQVWVLSSSLAFDTFDVADPVQAAKVLSVPVWFSLLALARFVARRALGLGRWASLVPVAAVALLAPLNYPLLEANRSSYLGFVDSSGSLYHNAPQLYSVAMGMAALALIGVWAEGGRVRGGPAVAAAALVAASFLFKPAVFVVMAPALVVVGALSGREGRRRALGADLVLLLPLVWWLAYPHLVGMAAEAPRARVDPFAYYFLYAADRFPPAVSSRPWLLASAVLTFSFAAWCVPAAAWVGRTTQALRRGGRWRLAVLRGAVVPIVVILALGFGVGLAVLLVEEGERAAHGNFTWPVAAAYVLSLPLLARLIADVRTRTLRWAAWALGALQLAAGGLHLWILVTQKHL